MTGISAHDHLRIQSMSNLEVENRLDEIDWAITCVPPGKDVVGQSEQATAFLTEAERRGYDISPEMWAAAEAQTLDDWELIHKAELASRAISTREWRWNSAYGPEISRRWTYEAACEAIEAERRKGYICEDASAPPQEWWIKPPNPEVDRKCL